MPKSTYLNIGGVPEHFNIPWKKSIDESFFSLKNIELEWHDYRGGTGDLIQALLTKKLDIAVMLTEGAVKSIAENAPIRIAQIYVNSPIIWGVYVHSTSKYSSLSEIDTPHFCISRYNSGSHLMAYILSQKNNWEIQDSENFAVVGNFLGALSNMQANPANIFLWERFMTKPSVDSGVLKKISEIPTPWASFCIVVREDFNEIYPKKLATILEIISNYTYKFKQNTQSSIEYIANYFNFSISDMVEWMQETDWNYFYDPPQAKIKETIKQLSNLKLINSNKNVNDYIIDI